MLTANKLEKIMELEDNLRSEYQAKLDATAAELEGHIKDKQELQATIDRQLETISDLSGKASVNQRAEQQNRELNNRSDRLQEELTELKKRVKVLQRDLAGERDKVKELTQFDPKRMKKNLDAAKKKLAEKNNANELLQKSLNKAKSENAEQQRKVKELEAKLEELQSLLGNDKENEAA